MYKVVKNGDAYDLMCDCECVKGGLTRDECNRWKVRYECKERHAVQLEQLKVKAQEWKAKRVVRVKSRRVKK
jgi:hypothetical protein